jgi:hypothetical protein
VIEAFLAEQPKKFSGTHVSTDGHTLLSYDMPIARHAPNSTMLIIRYTSAPSTTTRTHVREVESATRHTRPDLFVSNVEAIDNDRRELFPNIGPGARARTRAARAQGHTMRMTVSKSKREISFDSDLETMFQEYQHLEANRSRGTSTSSFAIALLGNAMYAKPFKWNIQPTVLEEPKVALRHYQTLGISTSKSANAQRADYFEELAKHLADEAKEVTQYAYETYGDSGSLIAGCGRDHFPEDIKNRLRFLNYGHSKVVDAARLHEFLSKTRSPQFH